LVLSCAPTAEPLPSEPSPGGSHAIADRSTVQKIVGTSADLALRATVAPSAPRTGQPLAFILSVSNRGPDVTTNVQLLFNLPPGSTLLGSPVGDGWACSLDPVRLLLSCARQQLVVGNAPELVVSIAPDPSATIAVGSASVSSIDSSDPDPTNNGATASAPITYDPSGLRTAAFAGGGFGCSHSGSRPQAGGALLLALGGLALLRWRRRGRA
jgi:uncharacterized repeat protein (TIGR01451 family)/MYXO-CTERM domain-containing protein